jgi:chromosome segregation ATPase
VQSLYKEKSDLFDELQMRTAELESSQTRLEQSLSQCNELQFQLRNSSESIASLHEEVTELRHHRRPDDGHSATEDITRLLLETEGRYEARLSDARTKIRLLEKERSQAEEEWTRGSNEKTLTLGNLRRDLEAKDREKNSILARQKDSDNVISKLQVALRAEQQTTSLQKLSLEDLEIEQGNLRGREASLRQELHDYTEEAESLARQLESLKTQDSQLKLTNKVSKLARVI